MNKKGFIFTIAIAVVFAAMAYLAGSINKNDSASAKKSNDQFEQSAFLISSESETEIKLSSVLYNFSFIVGAEYGYIENQLSDSEFVLYTFSRRNANTSEELNRDTPDGFNTSVDDSLDISVLENDQKILTENLSDFISWHNITFPSSEIIGSAITHAFNSEKAIEVITMSGIDSEARELYFISDSYIIKFSSSDVPKDEMYMIANSFYWL